jgi:DNA-directed RNA polymerase subunit L
VIDMNTVIQNLMGAVDYNLADMAIKDTGVATQQERDDEINKVSQIIGSGLDMPLPQSGNFQLRLQTLQSTMQDALQNNPATRKQIQQNPDIMKVIQKRAEYYQNQLQQQQNAQIGRSLATRTFTKQAPQLAAPPGPLMTPAAGPMQGPGQTQGQMASDGMGY